MRSEIPTVVQLLNAKKILDNSRHVGKPFGYSFPLSEVSGPISFEEWKRLGFPNVIKPAE